MLKLVARVLSYVVFLTAASGALADAAGSAQGVDPAAEARGGETRTLVVGADIFIGDRIVTGASGQVQILFSDSTKLVVGPRSALLMFNVDEDGSLEALEGYHVDAEGNFNKEFMLRGAAMRYGDRLLGQYVAEHYDEGTEGNVTDGAARFDLKIVEAKP